MGDSRHMFRYLGAIARREGAFVIIPDNGAVKGLPENLRAVPSTVMTPDNRRTGEFAERGTRGSWMLIWMPPDLCLPGASITGQHSLSLPRCGSC